MSNRIHNFRMLEKMNIASAAKEVEAPIVQKEVKVEKTVQSATTTSFKKKTFDTEKVLKEITEAQDAISEFASDVQEKEN